ncbi:hypothetical protein [Streptomyces sp. 8L]|uniref:hypothetical protein n=1 Tax=Streptomyces sp. 8L TaxID=2877242 RepID=UPI001CD5147A|nr:hypothetical protein [Streptomyces sp. 8L]MCA1217387.1 hypothetical protein [Streptomyces sp. 8L]
MRATLIIEGAEIHFDMAPTDVQPVAGGSFVLPLSGYELRTEITAVVVTFPESLITLSTSAYRRYGKSLAEYAEDLEQTAYASNVTVQVHDEDD